MYFMKESMRDFLKEIPGGFSEGVHKRMFKEVLFFLVLSFRMNFQGTSKQFMNKSIDFLKKSLEEFLYEFSEQSEIKSMAKYLTVLFIEYFP